MSRWECSDLSIVFLEWQGKWLPTLKELVVKINETFGHNFKEMAVAGEVSLGKLRLYSEHFHL